MITPALVERFVTGAPPASLRAATRYAEQARVGSLIGSAESVSTVVRGVSKDREVVLWSEHGALQHRCGCASWRLPCKHAIAAALVLRQWIARPPDPAPDAVALEKPAAPGRSADDARDKALEERRLNARRERLRVRLGESAPLLVVQSGSGFAYHVHLRGGASGPHGCDCPDFEANRLHACKHVERVRAKLAAGQTKLPPAWRSAAARPRVYLHFGEVVEPRLLSPAKAPERLRRRFDSEGVPLPPLCADLRELRDAIASFGNDAEPEALAWCDRRVARTPEMPDLPAAKLLPRTALTPHPYQVEGAMFLARTGRALLADEMGLGKTAQAIMAAVAMRKARTPVEHVTIVCPASLRSGWQEEIARWVSEDAVLLEGPAPERARTVAMRPRWLVTHFEQVLRDHPVHAAHPPDLLVIDEAQRAKGLHAQTARALKAIDAPHVFALTGTPLENRLEEAYAIAQLVDQRLLPPLWQLDLHHFVRDDKGRRVVAYRNLDALRSRLAPAFLRRRKEDVALQLPDRVRSIAFVPMHEAVIATYEDVMSQVSRIARKKVLLPADLDRIQRLLVIARRACNGPHMLGIDVDDRKVPKLAELRGVLEDLCIGERRKVVVFSEWTDMTDRVEALCRRMKLPTFHLHGGVPLKQRGALIAAFRGERGPAVFVSTDAGGVGLNLQVADAVVSLDLPWNPARLEQRIARVHRIGSQRTVNEILMVARDTVEHRILMQHETKRNVLANVWASTGADEIAAPGGSGAFKDVVMALLATSAPEEIPATPVEELVAPAEAVSEAPPGPPVAPAPALDVEALARAVAAVAPTLPSEHRASLATVFRALAGALEGGGA